MHAAYYIENGTFPREDYEALLGAAQGCKTAVEFGPGHSTRALIEAGVEFIRSYEDDPRWASKWQVSLAGFARHMKCDFKVLHYKNEAELGMQLGGVSERYDIAVVDAPKGTATRKVHKGQEGLSRFNTLAWSLSVARKVLLHDCDRPGEQCSIEAAGCKGIIKLTPKLWIVQNE